MTKLTGWARFRRWTKRILLGLLALLVLLIAVGSIYEALGRKNAREKYPPPGSWSMSRRKSNRLTRHRSKTVLLNRPWHRRYDRWKRSTRDSSFTRTCDMTRRASMWRDSRTRRRTRSRKKRSARAIDGRGLTISWCSSATRSRTLHRTYQGNWRSGAGLGGHP